MIDVSAWVVDAFTTVYDNPLPVTVGFQPCSLCPFKLQTTCPGLPNLQVLLLTPYLTV